MTTKTFSDLGLNDNLLSTLKDIGYEEPSPIQEQSIPTVLQGKDVIGMAQTGTGKTAAFALPILNNIDVSRKKPQVLVLAPTRELAIQVAEAFQTFARNIKGLHVLPIYGGAEYGNQIRSLKRGVNIVVGTPGRVMDHIKKGTLKLDELKTLILDEADEMLKMGFIDDVEWVLSHMPETRQIVLFSATMPAVIKKIAAKYLKNPQEIVVKQKTTTATTIEQKYWFVSGLHKLDALTRILEVEQYEGIIIFVKTKNSTVELAEKLAARGYAASALNGDIAQNNRERIVNQLKQAKLDILVATDVAARGLDVDRVSHVINYDIPRDTESYVHRIGRTGRAGRKGTAILFVSPREKRLLSNIERVNKTSIKEMQLPSTKDINDTRIEKFKDKIIEAVQSRDLDIYQEMIEQIEQDKNIPSIEIAAGLAKLLQGNEPFFLQEKYIKPTKNNFNNKDGRSKNGNDARNLTRYRLNVGTMHKIKASNIIGAIANEANIDSSVIQKLSIEKNESFVSLPNDLSKKTLTNIANAWVGGQQLKLTKINNSKSSNFKKRKPKNNNNHSNKNNFKSRRDKK